MKLRTEVENKTRKAFQCLLVLIIGSSLFLSSASFLWAEEGMTSISPKYVSRLQKKQKTLACLQEDIESIMRAVLAPVPFFGTTKKDETVKKSDKK